MTKPMQHTQSTSPSWRDPGLSIEKPLPLNLEAERAILGAIILSNKYFEEVVPIIKPEWFFREQHKKCGGDLRPQREIETDSHNRGQGFTDWLDRTNTSRRRILFRGSSGWDAVPSGLLGNEQW